MASSPDIKNPFSACTNPNLPNEEVFPFISIFLTIFVITFFVLTLRHAIKTNQSSIVYLISASIFGYLLEITMISLTRSYCYNPKWIGLIGPVPIAIALSWGIFIYITRLIIEKTNLSIVVGALFQAFFTVLLDFILDPVAIRFSLWTWGLDIQGNIPDFNKDYFGIPWGNYWGWHWAIFSYSLMFQIVYKFIENKTNMKKLVKDILTGLLTIILGLGVGFAIIMIFANYEKVVTSPFWQSMLILAVFIVDIRLTLKEKMHYTEKIDSIARVTFLSFYLLFSAMWLPLATTIPVLFIIIIACGFIFYYVLIYLPRGYNG